MTIIKNSFSLLFFIRKERAGKTGKVPIYLRISTNGTTSELSIGRKIEPHQWDSGSGKVKGENAKPINSFMETVRAKVFQHHQELIASGEPVDARQLKYRYLGQDPNSKSLIEAFEYHNELIKKLKGIDFAEDTIQRYETTFMHIRDFLKKHYDLKDIPLNYIRLSFIDDFEFYLKTTRNCAHNTSIKYVKNFKKIINLSLKNGWLVRNPFPGYTGKLKEVKIEFLTQPELDTIYGKEIDIPRLDFVRDFFLFACYTGLSFSDIDALTKDNIYTDQDGTQWVKTYRKKTKNASNIPLLPIPLGLIDKYKSHPQVNGSRLFPQISNQKFNAYLKEVGTICGIKKRLFSHLGRHTFATTVTLANGVRIEALSKMLGHSTITMTQRYAKVIESFVKNEMKKIDNNQTKNQDEK